MVLLELESSRFKRERERGKKKACFSLRVCLSSRARSVDDCDEVWIKSRERERVRPLFFFDFCVTVDENKDKVREQVRMRLYAQHMKTVIF